MKKYFSAMVAVFTVMLNVTVAKAEVNAQEAQKFVENVTKDGIENIVDANVSQQEKDARFTKLFNDALDMKFIGQFVLGRYWRTATPAQREAFINAYRELNIKTWSKRFDEFKGHNFVFGGTKPSNSANQIFVNTTVPMEQGQPAKVVWRVKQNGDSFKIVDIIIENVSLAITARNEYTAYIKNNAGGLEALIKDLQKKTTETQQKA